MYKDLNVRDRDVLDVGANVGDTAIYFALKGARRVIALEPYPSLHKLATKNIEADHLEKNVIVPNEGGAEHELIRVDQHIITNGETDLRSAYAGKNVKVNNLEDLVTRFSLRDAVLKVDCEGCEYPLLLNST